ncbi:MAG: hypothetical protein ACE5JV_00810 [Nitrososphaerales archaeon]
MHGKSYYKIISALKSLNLKFDSVSPEEATSHDSHLVITTRAEKPKISHRNILLDSELDEEPALIRARILRSLMGRFQDDQLIIGIDPGRRIGLAAFYLQKEIESRVITSTRAAADLVTVLVRGTISRKKLVRIGFGDPVMARSIAEMIYARFKDQVTIEFVNEHGTSSSVRTVDSNRRGVRDRVSARVIALRKGRVFRPMVRVRN